MADRQRSFFDTDFQADLAAKRTGTTLDQQRARLGFTSATAEDLARLSEQKLQVLELLSAGWCTSKDLILATGATEAPRRLRELRTSGFEIKQAGTGRSVVYRWTGRVRK